MVDKKHVEVRDKIDYLLKEGLTIEEISNKLFLPLGTRFEKGSAKWYRYCIRAKENQKKAIEKDPHLYSKAGKIAQQKHPWIGVELGKKYGKIQGKINADRLKGNKVYFSNIAKRLHEINPNHSKKNIRKAHETMKKSDTFNEHQRLAALKCREKHPNQLKEMSNKAHRLYPLALLALESHRKNYPYEFMGCLFDSKGERTICKKLVEKGLIKRPIENKNIHFRINKHHIDFFINSRLFLEFHPARKFGGANETNESYYNQRRELLDKNGFKQYPLIVINSLRNADNKIEKMRDIIHPL